MVATPAIIKEGHSIAITRCIKGIAFILLYYTALITFAIQPVQNILQQSVLLQGVQLRNMSNNLPHFSNLTRETDCRYKQPEHETYPYLKTHCERAFVRYVL